MDEIVREFLVESADGLDQLDRDLVTYERNPEHFEVLDGIFRVMHTVKGTAGLLGFANLERVTHTAENLLGVLRDERVPADPELIDGLLGTVDAVRDMLSRIEHEGTDGGADHASLVKFLNHLHQRVNAGVASGEFSAAGDAAAPAETPAAAAPDVPPAAPPAPPAAPGDVLSAAAEELAAVAGGGETAAPVAPDAAPPAAPTPPAVPAAADPAPPAPTSDPVPAAEEPVAPAAAAPAKSAAARPISKPVHVEETLRVDVRVLDDLMDVVGELVLTRNQIVRSAGALDDKNLVAATARLDALTSELQEGVMRTRMQPIDTVWAKLPRLVRDLSAACGKRVRIEMDGQNTELDKTLIEAIRDPLTHLIRNSVDHGIESPERREAQGKPAEGTLELRAHHKGGRVNIEIVDDGRGIDPAKIRARVMERDLVPVSRLNAMSDSELVDLIFLPGFSTAEEVTAVSGRGVGMDVVRTNIERIGGRIEIESRVGEGTTIRIGVPLTLAIVPALTVRSGPQEFAIAQTHLLELIRVEDDGEHPAVEWVHSAPVHRLRGNLLPLVDLRAALGFPPALFKPTQTGSTIETRPPVLNIVVLQAGEQRFGLVVDEVEDTLEIVVKPMSALLDDADLFAGTTILGDGRVALILDVLGVAQHAHVAADEGRSSGQHELEDVLDGTTDLQDSYIVVDASRDRVALPMRDVARMEHVDTSRIEHINGGMVLQYRGEILQLADLTNILDPTSHGPFDQDSVPVVVCNVDGRELGVVCSRILDVEAVAGTSITDDDLSSQVPVLSGAAVIDDRVVQIVDLHVLFAQVLRERLVTGGVA